MVTDVIFKTVGGLGLFLFGMGLMSDGLKRVAGQKLRNILESLTKRPVIAVLVGALTTCLVQSSSATTVMTVGFVNAALLSLRQALCVVLGANVGTTFTAWLVSGLGVLKITLYSLPAVGVGFLVQVVGKTQRTKSIGQILLGFGLLFLGISFMKDAFEPLRDSTNVQAALIWLGGNPILAVITGTIITMLLQSSSASIAMVQVLAFNGAFGTDWDVALRVAIPFILGDNIGTTITAQIAALRASRNARRVAWGHTILNVIGVVYMLPLVWSSVFSRFVIWIVPGGLTQNMIMLHIAVAHSVFNVFNTVLFLPVIGWLEGLVMKLLPVTEAEAEQQPVVLEQRLLDTPVIALEQAKREIIQMAGKARKAVSRAIGGLAGNNMKSLEQARQLEDVIDHFQHEITSYLVGLSNRQLSNEVSTELPVLLHMVNDLERVGDHAVNIVEIAERKIEQKITFSDIAINESSEMIEELYSMFESIIAALQTNAPQSARLAMANENRLNRMQVQLRRHHVQRMTDGSCSAESGLIFIDLVDNIEKIGDHLTNIAQSVLGGLRWDSIENNSLTGEYKAITTD